MMDSILGYLDDVLSGRVAQQGLQNLAQSHYDPSQSPAQNARNPLALQQAMDMALGFTGGGLANRTAPAAAAAGMPHGITGASGPQAAIGTDAAFERMVGPGYLGEARPDLTGGAANANSDPMTLRNALRVIMGDEGGGGPALKGPIRAYHGSQNSFDKFDSSKIGTSTDAGALGRAHYFSTDPVVAEGSPHRYEVNLNMSNPLSLELSQWPTPGRDMGSKQQLVTDALGLPADATSEAITAAARGRGHDSVSLDYSPLGYKHQELAVFDPSLIEILRKYGLAGLLGGTGAVAGMAGQAQAQQAQQAPLLGGDPEAAGAAQASTAMEPVTGPYLHDVVTGKIGYDAAQNLTPLDVAMGFSGGGLGTRAVRAPRIGVGHNNPPPDARFPQYAERYPEVGPPAPAIDKVTGKPYPEKQLTPEAEAFAAERQRIAKDMQKNGYEPYYDPAQRFHVDPTNYPPNFDTTTIVPKRQTTIDNDMRTIGSDEARGRLQAAYQRGTELPNTADWYAMGQLEQDFIKRLGPEAGRKAFQDRFATSMAATTGGADPTSNWLMAAYGNYLRGNGLPYPTAAHEMPYPIGGRYATGNMEQHQKIFDKGGWESLGLEGNNPKRHNFAQNFTGNRNASTMDEQMTSGMTPGVNMPPPGKYGLYEGVLADEAAKVGVLPQNFQDVAWAGFKNMKKPQYREGQPMISVINDSIERTHRLTGMPKDEIVARGIIEGKIPLYSALLGLGLGTASGQAGAQEAPQYPYPPQDYIEPPPARGR